MRGWDLQTDDPVRIVGLWRSLQGDLRRRGVDRHTAEDITQETWRIALERPPEERGRFRGWMHVVAGRLLARRRADGARLALVEVPERVAEEPDGIEPGELARLARCVEELPERHRIVVRLHFFEGLDVAALARELAITPDAARSRLKRALERLRLRMTGAADRRPLFAILAAARELLRRLGARHAALGAASGAALLVLSIAHATDVRFDPAGTAASTDVERAPVAAARSGAPSDEPGGAARAPGSPASTAPRSPFLPLDPPRLRGTVRSPTGEPVAGAFVYAGDSGRGLWQPFTWSAADGSFEVVANGEHVSATHPRWCASSRAYLPFLRDRAAGADLTLDIVLGATRGLGTVTVRSAAGEPVPSALVRIEHAPARREGSLVLATRGTLELSGETSAATTDARGRAELPFPDAPSVEIRVDAPSLPPLAARVTTPSDGGEIELVLPAPVALRGRCTDAAGRPVEGAHVEALQLDERVRRLAQSAADGSFGFDALAPGEVTLRAWDGTGASARHDGILAPDDAPELALVLREASSVLGRVVDARGVVEGARVVLETGTPSSPERRSTTSDAAGRFAFPGCRPLASHSLLVFAPGAAHAGAGERLLRAGAGERTYVLPERTDTAPLEIEYAGAPGDVPWALELRRTWPALSVLATRAAGETRFLPGLPAGDYEVIAWHPELGTWSDGVLAHDPAAPRRRVLESRRGGALEVELELPAGVDAASVEVALVSPRIALQGPDLVDVPDSLRMLGHDGAPERRSARVRAGEHALVVSGGGIAETRARVHVAEGAAARVVVAPARGADAILVLVADGRPGVRGLPSRKTLMPTETLRIDAFTPAGKQTLEFLGHDVRVRGNEFELPVVLPADALALEVLTEAPSAILQALSVRAGRRTLACGELVGRPDGPPRIEIALVDME